MAGREKRVGVPVSRGVFFPGEVCCYGRFGGKMPMSLVVRMGGDSALISLLSLLLLLLPLLSTARDTPRLMWITYTIVSASPTSHSPVFPSVHVPGVSASWACRRNDRLFHVSPPPCFVSPRDQPTLSDFLCSRCRRRTRVGRQPATEAYIPKQQYSNPRAHGHMDSFCAHAVFWCALYVVAPGA